jgi:putative Ca2+/H+ antiporter (TMEM165/GDT1 family)
MMVANVPAVWMGEALAHRVNMKWMRWVAAGLFIVLGGLTLLAGDDAVRLPRAEGPPAGAVGR